MPTHLNTELKKLAVVLVHLQCICDQHKSSGMKLSLVSSCRFSKTFQLLGPLRVPRFVLGMLSL